MEQIMINEMVTKVECVLSQGNSFDDIALHMLQNNKIEGLISIIKYDNRIDKLYYDIEGKISLDEFLEEVNEWQRVKDILIEICQKSFDQFVEYMLFQNQIYYDPQYIFIENDKIEYIYIPEKASNATNLKDMLSEVLANNKWNMGVNKRHFETIIQYLHQVQWFGDREKEQFVESLKQINIEIHPEPVSPIPIYENQNEFQTTLQEAYQPQAYSDVGETMVLNASMLQAQPTPYLIRQRTMEKIEITMDYFRLGKNTVDIDYTITGNPAISRSHAVINRKNNTYYIQDTNSKNHTWIDGEIIYPNQEKELVHKTKIKMADEEFIFYTHD